MAIAQVHHRLSNVCLILSRAAAGSTNGRDGKLLFRSTVQSDIADSLSRQGTS